MIKGPSSSSDQSHPNANFTYEQTPLSKFIGAAIGATVEQGVFHPIDTTAKTLMANKGDWKVLANKFQQRGLLGGTQSLYNGFSIGLLKKAPLRVYKYGVQDEINSYMSAHYKHTAAFYFGSYGNVILQSFAGAMTGIIEPCIFQPIDTLQIRKQVFGEKISLESAQNLGLKGLYRGAIFTGIARNAPGSIGLFGGSELANKMLHNDDHQNHVKNLFSKWAGAFVSLVLSQPGDVIKTNMQAHQLSLRKAIDKTTFKQLVTSGLTARLFMSLKVGVGYFVIERAMIISKNIFGKKKIKKENTHVVTSESSEIDRLSDRIEAISLNSQKMPETDRQIDVLNEEFRALNIGEKDEQVVQNSKTYLIQYLMTDPFAEFPMDIEYQKRDRLKV